MSNIAQPCLGRAGSLGPGRLGQWLYQTGHWDDSAFINIQRFAAHGACPIPRTVDYTYNGFVADVPFHAASDVQMEYHLTAFEDVAPDPPTTRAYRETVRWENLTPPLTVYNFTDVGAGGLPAPLGTIFAATHAAVPIHPRNIWGATGASLTHGWMPARGLWLFDITITFNGAMLDPFNSTPRTARLMTKAHRYYSLGLNRDQTLRTWEIGLGGATTKTFRQWLHVDPLWFVWVDVGAEYTTEQPNGTELIAMHVRATRLSPPPTP